MARPRFRARSISFFAASPFRIVGQSFPSGAYNWSSRGAAGQRWAVERSFPVPTARGFASSLRLSAVRVRTPPRSERSEIEGQRLPTAGQMAGSRSASRTARGRSNSLPSGSNPIRRADPSLSLVSSSASVGVATADGVSSDLGRIRFSICSSSQSRRMLTGRSQEADMMACRLWVVASLIG
jgi:hypothetical protein